METGDGHPFRSEQVGKRIVAVLNDMVDRFVLLFMIMMLLVGLYSLYDSRQVYDAADAAQYNAYKPVTEESPSFAQLRQRNGEVIGWLTVNDTPIDYPIVQAQDNDKYLDTTVEGEYRLSGSIFLDYRDNKDFSDYNSIIYGHHMEQKKMFGCLSDFGDKAYFDAHPYGNLYFRSDWSSAQGAVNGFANKGVEFFAVILTDAYDFALYHPAVEGEEHQKEYLEHIYDIAMHTREVDIGPQDHIVLLSTCTTEITNGRYLLVGRLTDQLYPQKEEQKVDIIGAGVDTLTRFPGILFWFVFVLILRVVMALRRRRKKKEQS